MKRNVADAVFSNLVRTRAKWTCECCGSWHGDSKASLHCSHHISRRFNATRLDSRNAAAHCASCHRKFTDDPVMHGEWIEAKIGKETYLELRAAANRTCQIKKHEWKEIVKTLKWQLEQMNEGCSEEFIGWRG